LATCSLVKVFEMHRERSASRGESLLLVGALPLLASKRRGRRPPLPVGRHLTAYMRSQLPPQCEPTADTLG
jgi:hypothetical protein